MAITKEVFKTDDSLGGLPCKRACDVSEDRVQGTTNASSEFVPGELS